MPIYFIYLLSNLYTQYTLIMMLIIIIEIINNNILKYHQNCRKCKDLRM